MVCSVPSINPPWALATTDPLAHRSLRDYPLDQKRSHVKFFEGQDLMLTRLGWALLAVTGSVGAFWLFVP